VDISRLVEGPEATALEPFRRERDGGGMTWALELGCWPLALVRGLGCSIALLLAARRLIRAAGFGNDEAVGADIESSRG
jgi:hypothetical protein